MPSGARGQKGNRKVALEACIQRIGLSALPIGSRLADRLSGLATAFAEGYHNGSLSHRAIDALVTFLDADASFGYPDLTATPAGDLYAESRSARGPTLTIEFLDSGGTRYLVFGPNPGHPQRTDRLTGFTTADALPRHHRAARPPYWPLRMKGDMVPDGYNVTCLCGGSHIREDGTIAATAFKPRHGKSYLSVNWLEFLSLPDRSVEIAEFRRALGANRKIGGMSKLAVLNVREAYVVVLQGGCGRSTITVRHKPEPGPHELPCRCTCLGSNKTAEQSLLL